MRNKDIDPIVQMHRRGSAWYKQHKCKRKTRYLRKHTDQEPLHFKLECSGIGTSIVCTCNHCDKEQDLTDYSNW